MPPPVHIVTLPPRVSTPTGKSEVVSTVSTQDACVSTEDDGFVDTEEPEEELEEPECCQTDLITRMADKVFTCLTRRLFRKYSPRWFLPGDHFTTELFQDPADDDIPGHSGGDRDPSYPPSSRYLKPYISSHKQDIDILILDVQVILGIDSKARTFFPLVFLALQASYWTAYLYWL